MPRCARRLLIALPARAPPARPHPPTHPPRFRAPQGTLFRYGEASPLLALQQGGHSRHVVLVGGLTDGMLFATYCEPLAEALDALGWSTVHAQLSSSYQVRCSQRTPPQLLGSTPSKLAGS